MPVDCIFIVNSFAFQVFLATIVVRDLYHISCSGINNQFKSSSFKFKAHTIITKEIPNRVEF